VSHSPCGVLALNSVCANADRTIKITISHPDHRIVSSTSRKNLPNR
jgi:hypothetical protein